MIAIVEEESVALACLFRFKSKALIPAVVAGAALVGWVFAVAMG